MDQCRPELESGHNAANQILPETRFEAAVVLLDLCTKLIFIDVKTMIHLTRLTVAKLFIWCPIPECLLSHCFNFQHRSWLVLEIKLPTNLCYIILYPWTPMIVLQLFEQHLFLSILNWCCSYCCKMIISCATDMGRCPDYKHWYFYLYWSRRQLVLSMLKSNDVSFLR